MLFRGACKPYNRVCDTARTRTVQPLPRVHNYVSEVGGSIGTTDYYSLSSQRNKKIVPDLTSKVTPTSETIVPLFEIYRDVEYWYRH